MKTALVAAAFSFALAASAHAQSSGKSQNMQSTEASSSQAESGSATVKENEGLLDFAWLSAKQKDRVEKAHQALQAANHQMCDTIVDIYAEHIAHMHQGKGDALPEEMTDFYKRRCEAQALVNHVEQSIALHDVLHERAHAHEG